jgi:hypothetical protein
VTATKLWIRGLIAARRVHWERVLIVVKALAVIAGVFYPVWWIHVRYLYNKLPSLPLSLAVSFLGVQIAIILMQLIASSVVKKLDAINAARSANWRVRIQRILAEQLARQDRHEELRRFRRFHTADFDRVFAAALSTLSGAERDYFSALAVELDLVKHWQRVARRGKRERRQAIEWMGLLSPHVGRSAILPLLDRHDAVSEPAPFLALSRFSNGEELGVLFLRSLTAPLIIRATLAGEFQGHAEELASSVIPLVLSTGDDREIIAALEMLEGWRKVLHLPQIATLVEHENPEIRSRALRAAHLSAVRGGLEQSVLRAVDDTRPAVLAAGLVAAARMQVRSAFRGVEKAVNHIDRNVSRMACLTLATFGKDGQSMLEYFVVTGNRRVSGWAAEALTLARTGRELAREF